MPQERTALSRNIWVTAVLHLGVLQRALINRDGQAFHREEFLALGNPFLRGEPQHGGFQ